MRYTNHYEHCGQSWSCEWSCMCDDECPVCGTAISPHESDDADDRNTCSDCDAAVEELIICPDGAEICQACFDAGNH